MKSKPSLHGGLFHECIAELFILTRMPSNLDRALRGLKARRVLRDLIAAKSEYPSEFATRLIKET